MTKDPSASYKAVELEMISQVAPSFGQNHDKGYQDERMNEFVPYFRIWKWQISKWKRLM